jgi:hypothetical protein
MTLPPATRERELTPAEGLQFASDLFQFGEDLMPLNFHRAHPTESEAEIETRVVAWLMERPGAEHGDAAGIPCTRLVFDE